MANKRGPTRQWGGTLLGIVLGMIVGLAIAVIVALYITQTPLPFIEKVPSHQSGNTFIEQMPSPNKALQNKTPLPNESSLLNDTEGSDSTVFHSEPAQTAMPPQFDILNEKASIITNSGGTKLTVPSVVPSQPQFIEPSNEDRLIYFLQVGAYKSKLDAEQQHVKLAFQGFETHVEQRDNNGLLIYRVRTGPYEKIDEMKQVRRRLHDMGIDTAVIRLTKP
ncbi:SPOR domain-containing protein [Candidatus Pandoraea novymonadis]|uniref:Cell division protein FtsN n=1 Tax=Candidatus Pandoraea novymonadis TaxID=1808959 RepID=A0ABX5FEK9_9BURK|nr:SPOR domain-containing protein [Candidatus Pandoraea novymonadis]PSB91726.1 Cell division protein FtsN [Candidatus Pandoraea novymonadis]